MRIIRPMCAAPQPPAASPWMFPELVFRLPDEQATRALAAALARFTVVGDLIRLEGDLGAGKSTFANAFVTALGHSGAVPSPTYTLVQTYDGTRVPVAHVDCYRLKEPAELDGLGLEDFRTHGVIVAEWPDKGGELLRADIPDMLDYHIGEMNNCGVITVALASGDSPASRIATVRGSRSWQRRIGFWPRVAPAVAAMCKQVLCRPVTEGGREAFLASLNLGPHTVQNLGGDMSFRTFWRVVLAGGGSRILMDSPPPVEGVNEFKMVADAYRAAGVRGPEVFAVDPAQGYLLMEDFGGTSLVKVVQSGADPLPWYKVAADALCVLCESSSPANARRYGPTDWWIEAARFTDWYMPLARGQATPPAERARFQALWMALYPHVMALPKGLMPWDYQATNMMVLGDEPVLENFGLIDIQDARVAPVVQDMAILLRDIRRDRDDALEDAVVAHVAARLNVDVLALQNGLDIANLHHCSRIFGGLARLAVRDGRVDAAQRYMARLWDVAKQSFGNPLLADLVAFMAPWEAPGMDAVKTMENAA